MDINYSILYTDISRINLPFVLWVLIFFVMTFVVNRLLLPPFSVFFSKPLSKIDIRTLYMFLIYILLSFMYAFIGIPILDFILRNTDFKIYPKILIVFGILFTGTLRILSSKDHSKDVSFMIFLQIVSASLAFFIWHNFYYKGSNYILVIHDEFLSMIEQGIFLDIFPFLVILFIFNEFIVIKNIFLNLPIK